MKMSDQLDIPTALTPGKEPAITVDEHIKRALQPIWEFKDEKKNVQALQESNYDSPVVYLAA
jgi:hypothetical protein